MKIDNLVSEYNNYAHFLINIFDYVEVSDPDSEDTLIIAFFFGNISENLVENIIFKKKDFVKFLKKMTKYWKSDIGIEHRAKYAMYRRATGFDEVPIMPRLEDL